MNEFKKKISTEHIGLFHKAASLDLSLADSQKLRERILKAVAVTPQVKPAFAQERKYFKQARFVFIFRTAFVVLVGILMVGSTVFASGFSKPGDLLYPVKIMKEAVEIKLAPTEKAKAMLEAKHAVARLQELSEIQAEVASSTRGSVVASSTPIVQAKEQADAQVNNAYRSLVQVQIDLQAKGQKSAAIEATINTLEEKAKIQDIQINSQIEQIGPEHSQNNSGQTTSKNNNYRTNKKDSGENNKSGSSTTTMPSGSGIRHAANDSGAPASASVISTVFHSSSTGDSGYKIIQPDNTKSNGEVKGTSTQQQSGGQITKQDSSGTQSSGTNHNQDNSQKEGQGSKGSGDD